MRLQEKFQQLKKKKEKAFIAYVPFGFPHPRVTKDICLSLEAAGVDIIELGIPFSDPLADGPIIQRATTESLAKGANINNFFSTLKQLKEHLTIPLVIMSYYNPIFKFGLVNFFKVVKSYNISAILIVDLPVEEAGNYICQAKKFCIDTIFFITPTTSYERIKKIVSFCKGFVYYISVTGITGPKDLHYFEMLKHIKNIKKLTNLPICVGFGIHTRKQVRAINQFADGVIVGSSIVRFIEKNYRAKKFLKRLKNYTAALCMK